MAEYKTSDKAMEQYQQVGRDFIALYRSFLQLYGLKGGLNNREQSVLERSFVDLIAFGIDLDVDDALEPTDNYDDIFKEMVRLVKHYGLVFCTRLRCPFRKRPKTAFEAER